MSQMVADHISTLTTIIVFEGVVIAFLAAMVVALCFWPKQVAATAGKLPKKLAAAEGV